MQYDYKIQLFFSPLQTKVSKLRKQFLDELEREFDAEDDFFNHNGDTNYDNNNLTDRDKYYPVLLRLSYECPFQDVRESCSRILSKLEVGIVIFNLQKFKLPINLPVLKVVYIL